MTLIRSELRAGFWAAREIILGGLIAALGLWALAIGGWLLIPIGLAVTALGAAIALIAFRRLRFGQGVHAPGIVEVDEAQISYFGPEGGGLVSLTELAELRLAWLNGLRHWRLKQADGQTLLVPVAAVGADRLFDAFAALPGMASQSLITALNQPAETGTRALAPVSYTVQIGPVIWRRPHLLALT